MARLAWVAVVLAAAFLSACGSTPQSAQTAAPSTTAPAATAAAKPQSQAVNVPAASGKKVVLNMTGPKTVTEAKDWVSFKEEWRATFAEHAKAQGIAFSMLEADVRVPGEPGTLLNVYVNDYRQVGIGARIFFGVMTGNAYIDANVEFNDLNGGQTFGDQAYNTSSSAWAGVFAKMTPQQIDTIATTIFASLKPR